MLTPSCYPDSCHTCESSYCYFEAECPVCGADLWINKHDSELTSCPECCAPFEWNQDGTLWAMNEDGEYISEYIPRATRDRHALMSGSLLDYLRGAMAVTAEGRC